MNVLRQALLITLLCATSLSHSENIAFYLEDEPIYTSSNTAAPGFLMEVVMEIVEQLNLQPEVHFLPWKRAQVMAEKTPNAVIFPLTRTAQREPNYTWVSELFEVPVKFVSIDPALVIDNFEAAGKLRGVGVIIGTPQEERLKAEGVSYITFTGQQIYDALASQKVSAIYAALPEALLGWKQLGHPQPLHWGATLQTLPLWIAANKNSDQVDVQAWKAALQDMRASGRFEVIYRRYFGSASNASLKQLRPR